MTSLDKNCWDKGIRHVQFAINNTVNFSPGKIPSRLLLGYTPHGGEDAVLRDEVKLVAEELADLVIIRSEAAAQLEKAQENQT